jgi:hypothetical protein
VAAGAWSSWARRLEQVTLQPGAHQDVRREAAYRGGQSAACPACCLEPASRSAQESPSVTVWLQVQPEHPVARSERPAQATVLPWAPALGVPAELLPQAASVRAAEPRRTAVLAAGEPGARKAVPEAAVSARAVAEPQPGAAQVASGRRAAVGAAAVPDGPQVAAAAAAVPDGPQVVAGAVAALLGAAVPQPAEALPADGEVQLRAAVRPGARAPQAARPLVVPSAAASVFRQGRSLVAAPARRQAAARLVHAMRSLRIASRSEPWWQAARNEGWSCGELPRKVL